ncbi:sensor histidine kinase [Arthrobacter castelli]|uniref:sensor histidine kinase n=1 Tax=Arthrobacter castelli TaxID=271431 RepID=UPI000412B7CA|nr:histidine kinase [Arthrobacter castelli]
MERLKSLIPDGLAHWWSDAGQWERPAPTPAQLRRDVVGAMIFVLASVLLLELTRSFGALNSDDHAVWQQYLAILLMTLPLTVRRRYPLSVMLVLSVLFIGLALWIPAISMQLPFQVAYFASLYTAVAWAKDRRLLWLATGVVITAMFTWLVLSMTVASAVDQIMEQAMENGQPPGPWPPVVSAAMYNFLINIGYFGGAVMAGQVSWRNALQRDQLAGQAARIERQSVELARRAVVDERLRIARELHDVVAHHISLIGVQAAAARRVLDRRPQVSAESLQVIENSSRDAVSEMRSLLGVLRTDTELPDGGAPGGTDGAAAAGAAGGSDDGGVAAGVTPAGDAMAAGGSAGDGAEPAAGNHLPDTPASSRRRADPSLADLPALVEEHRALGLDIEYTDVEHESGALSEVSAPVALSVYRTAQESLSNIRRHSTATRATMTLRTGESEGRTWIELETVDNGRPKPPAEDSSGYGLRGIQERVSLHRGTSDIGPRDGGGWRVRVRYMLQAETSMTGRGTL